jgi:hypothetical protein
MWGLLPMSRVTAKASLCEKAAAPSAADHREEKLMSTTGSVAVRPAPALRIASWSVLIVFAVGIGIGVLLSASAFALSQSDPTAPAAEVTAPPNELSRLDGNMEAAAERGDIRLFIEFREDLAQLVSSATISNYETWAAGATH